MVSIKINYNGSKVTLKGLGMNKYQMLKLGQFGLDTVKNRVAKGIGADDAKMPPLGKRYAIQKNRAGKGNFRNLRNTGAMLDNLTVRSASPTQVKIGLTQRLSRAKALANEKIASWLQWSEKDQKAIAQFAAGIFNAEVRGDMLRKLYSKARRAA